MCHAASIVTDSGYSGKIWHVFIVFPKFELVDDDDDDILTEVYMNLENYAIQQKNTLQNYYNIRICRIIL